MFPLRGFADLAVEKFPHRWMHLGAIGTLVAAMREAGCREVVMIGSLVRPRPWDVRFDFTTAMLVPRLLPLFRGGDDRLLKGVAKILEERGFRLVGAHEVAPEDSDADWSGRQAAAEQGRRGRHSLRVRFAESDRTIRHRASCGHREQTHACRGGCRGDGRNAYPHRGDAQERPVEIAAASGCDRESTEAWSRQAFRFAGHRPRYRRAGEGGRARGHCGRGGEYGGRGRGCARSCRGQGRDFCCRRAAFEDAVAWLNCETRSTFFWSLAKPPAMRSALR